METYSANYNFHKAFSLIFAFGFLSFAIFGTISPDSVTTTVNDKVVETSFWTLLPGYIIGTGSLLLFIWMTRNYFNIRMNEEGIVVNRTNISQQIDWNDIEAIGGVDWLWKGSIFWVKPKHQKKFYFHADKPKMNFTSMWKTSFDTEMSKFISKKKRELGI